MTKKLRKRIMLTMMLLLSITFITIIVAINIWILAGNRALADNSLRFLVQRELPSDTSRPSLPPPTDDSKPFPNFETPPFDDNTDRHTKIQASRFVLATYTTEGTFVSINNTLSDTYTDEEIRTYCEKILSKNKTNGTISDLRYVVHHSNSNITIAFIDQSVEQTNGRNLLSVSVILGLLGLVIFFFLSYYISGLMVRPIEEAFIKQKRFISDASHELKTPIAVILSNSELLEDQIGKNTQLSYIKNECDRMHHLVTSLLTLTKLEQTPYETMEKTTFSLSDAILERVLPLESIAYEKGLTMKEEIPQDVSFYGIKEQLQQVVDILIDNALQHTCKNGTIRITLETTSHHVIFCVHNTGDAIPPEEREQIFERFYRVDKARNRANGHYGLGLSIAKTIIENHKGKIKISCSEGITSFIVTLKQAEK